MRFAGLNLLSLQSLLIFFALSALSPQARAQGEVPKIVGTWKLNLAKSQFGGPPTRNLVHKWTWDGEALSHSIGDNKPNWSAKFDGKPYPVSGAENGSVRLTRVDAYTTQLIETNGKITSNFRQVVSKDGKTLTITRKSTTEAGQPVVDIEVFDRQ